MQQADVVGVLDTTTSTFSTVAVTGVTATSSRFDGAAAVDDSVYFAPYVSAPRAVPTFAPVCMFAIVCSMRHT